jgi:hypothetical protein
VDEKIGRAERISPFYSGQVLKTVAIDVAVKA